MDMTKDSANLFFQLGVKKKRYERWFNNIEHKIDENRYQG